MNKILVVIPYLPIAAQGMELAFAIAGWKRHFKEDHLIVVVGEGLPEIDEPGVVCLESKRVEPIEGQYRQHLDYVSCFQLVHKTFPDTKGFIFVADDVYAVNDFDMTDILFFKAYANDIVFKLSSTNAWRRDKAKTAIRLRKDGYPSRNFTTHLPQYFEWDKLEALWEKYDMLHNSYVMEDLYYNIYYPKRIPFILNENDNLKCGLYEDDYSINKVRDAFKSKIWIQNSPKGWNWELEAILARYYRIN
jgi:hypothetical protein